MCSFQSRKLGPRGCEVALARADDSVERPSLDSDLEGPLVRSTLRDGGGSGEKHTTIAVTLSVACFARQVSTCKPAGARVVQV